MKFLLLTTTGNVTLWVNFDLINRFSASDDSSYGTALWTSTDQLLPVMEKPEQITVMLETK